MLAELVKALTDYLVQEAAHGFTSYFAIIAA